MFVGKAVCCVCSRGGSNGVTDACALDMGDHEAGQDPVPARARLRVCYRAHRRAPLLAVSAHALRRRRIGPIVVRSANSPSSCKHQSGHDGIDTRTAGPGVIQRPGLGDDAWLLCGGRSRRAHDRFHSTAAVGPAIASATVGSRAALRLEK